jgi:MoxR-like ATPase
MTTLLADAPLLLPLALAESVLARLRARLRAQVIGRDDVIDLVIVALLADGHVLLEDYPGSGKTTLAKALGAAIEDDPYSPYAAFRRIQFTPDLLPSDITGVSVFDAVSSTFQFRHGPLFAHIVLADEINRTSPKVQSAMLEAMAEKQVTVDNVTHPLDELFFVVATQNPRDVAGTYPLPVPQLDRFLFKIRMDHIGREEELAVLRTRRERRDTEREDLALVKRAEVLAARRAIDENVTVNDAIHECLVDVSRTLRADERVRAGNSTRSLVLAVPALQALALLNGRDFVSGEDVERLLPHVLTHRIEAALGATAADEVVKECMVAPLERLARRTLAR